MTSFLQRVLDYYFMSDPLLCLICRRKCKTYYIRGERKGSVDIFVENLPGFPDNIRYDGEGHYWIAFASVRFFVTFKFDVFNL